MFSATVEGLLERRVRLDKAVIEAQGLSKKEVTLYNERRKELVDLDKLNALKAENCTIDYKGTVLPFNPVKVDGKAAIVWKTVDKNGILVASPDKDNKVKLTLIPCVASTNKQFTWRQALVSKTKNTVIQKFANVVEGLEWSEFNGKCCFFKGYKTIKATGALREIK